MENMQKGLIAGGDLYMDFYNDAGNLTGSVLAGNAKKLEIQVETETKENPLNGRDTLGQTADAYTRITSTSISILFNRYNPELLAANFMGSATDQTAAAGPYTATINGIHDRWVSIGEFGLDTCAVKDSTETTTYVKGTDYQVNLRTGMVMALSTGAITDGEELKISGNTLPKTGQKITGATRPMINVALRLDGKNYTDGSSVIVDVFKAQLRADSAFDFMGEEFPELSFSGTMLTPAGKSWPFEVF